MPSRPPHSQSSRGGLGISHILPSQRGGKRKQHTAPVSLRLIPLAADDQDQLERRVNPELICPNRAAWIDELVARRRAR